MADTRTASSPLETREGSSTNSALVSREGRTVIADVVVAKVAGIAAREVPGVYSLVPQGTGAALVGLTQRVMRTDATTQGVRVEVGEREAAFDLRIVVEYGVSIPQVADAVRQNVTERIQAMTGLRVKEVNIEVSDLHFPEEENAPEAEPRVQ